MVIVTGANGFIGSSLIHKLIKNNVTVLAIDRSFKEHHIPESDLITKVELELNDIDSIIKAIPAGDYDIFYHLAWRGVNGTDKANPIIQLENTQMTINCVTVAKKIGCKKILCAGTIAEQSINSLSLLRVCSESMIYGVAKHCTHLMFETYCKNIGLDFVWMQFANIYGPSNKTGNLVSYTIEKLANNKEAIFGPALQPYDFIYIDDLIEAVYRLGISITSQNCYYIGSGEPRILKEYLFEIGKLCGKRNLIRVGIRPDDGVVYTMKMFDTTRLVTDIGNYVSVTFTEGIKRTLKNY